MTDPLVSDAEVERACEVAGEVPTPEVGERFAQYENRMLRVVLTDFLSRRTSTDSAKIAEAAVAGAMADLGMTDQRCRQVAMRAVSVALSAFIPTDIETACATARAEERERCARVADEKKELLENAYAQARDPQQPWVLAREMNLLIAVATAIRALPDEVREAKLSDVTAGSTS